MDKNIKLPFTMFSIIILFSTIAQIIANINLPSLPTLAREWQVASGSIQLTITAYLIGFGLSHFIYGTLSDCIGRRAPLLAGIFISCVGSLICCLSTSFSIFFIGRLIQGVGIGACGSTGRSVSRDLMDGEHLARFNSHLGMVSTMALALAPVLGGYMQVYFGWRSIFIFLFAYTLFIGSLLFFLLPETNKLKLHKPNFSKLAQNYLTLICNKNFITYTLLTCLAYAGFMTFVSAAPFIFQTQMGLSPVAFGWLAYCVSIALLLSGFLNSKLVLNKKIKVMVGYGCLTMLAGAVALLIATFLESNIFLVVGSLMIFSVGAGLIFANSYSAALHDHAGIAGSASAAFGALQILSGALAVWIIATVGTTHWNGVAIILIIYSACCLTLFYFKHIINLIATS